MTGYGKPMEQLAMETVTGRSHESPMTSAANQAVRTKRMDTAGFAPTGSVVAGNMDGQPRQATQSMRQMSVLGPGGPQEQPHTDNRIAELERQLAEARSGQAR